MSSIPFSVRLSTEQLEALKSAAASAQRPAATLAAQLIVAGLDGADFPAAPADDHPLITHVLAAFSAVEGEDAGAHLESALVLARVAAAGGAPAVAAVKELRAILAEVAKLSGWSDVGGFA